MDEITAGSVYLYASFSQKHFSKSKNHSLNTARDQTTFLAQKR